MMRKVFVGVIFLALVPGLAVGGTQPFEKVGTYAAQFLKINTSARAAGMGSAFTAVANDASAIYWNPAGMVELSRTQVTLNSVVWPADIDVYFAGAVFTTPYFPGTFGISARALTMDPQEERTIYMPQGTNRYFDAGDMSFGLSYAMYFTDRFSAGITANFIHMGLADKSVETMAFDFGLIYRIGIQGMKLGMMIQSLGAEVDFDDRSSKLPTLFRVGLSVDAYRQGAHALLAAGEFSHPSDNKERMNVGMEYGFNQFFFLRGGYNIEYDSQGVAGGVGFRIDTSQTSDIGLDYAWEDLGYLGSAHRVTLNFSY
ncbi:MAG: PorV/PorQ family protein [Candidatus Krumholzibacteriota bacterium]|nr:PorV/PorQ family protein [Candidatus Krumholzibacteriota bacterium]